MPAAPALKPLTESTLRRLTNDALVTFLGEAEDYEASASPGLLTALCNEPIADLNMIVVGARASAERFRASAQACLDRELPFLTIIFPEAGLSIDETAKALGLVYAVDFPFMVREDVPMEPAGHPEVNVVRGAGSEDAQAAARVLESAFSMPYDSVMRAMPPELLESPGIDVYVARLGDRPVGTVTLTWHGDTCGIWAMGTDTRSQRGGIGRRLLSTVIAEARSEGARRFFLGATPAGFRLYESLGFITRITTRVWVYGETNQA